MICRHLWDVRIRPAGGYHALVTSPQTPGFGTDVLETDALRDERADERTTDAGDHERLSHYVPKDKLMDAMVNGTPVVALCGKIWVPSRDPQRFPVCPECKEIWETMRDGDSSGNGPGSGPGNGDGRA